MGDRTIVDEGEAERDDGLVPWSVSKEHRWAYPLMMLRTEERRRAGLDNSTTMLDRLDRWLEKIHRDDHVVAYDPASDEGFTYLARRSGIDIDLVRQPGHGDTPGRAGD